MRLGLLDWGVGGLDLHRRLLKAGRYPDLLYLSDAGFAPYGTLTENALAARVAACVTYLREEGCERVLLGCNAASSVLHHPLVLRAAGGAAAIRGVVAPAVAATLLARPREVTVLGGERTVKSSIYASPLRAAGLTVRQQVGQPLSAAIEAGVVAGPELDQVLTAVLTPIQDTSFLILACTHYPAVATAIRARLPALERLIDPAEETARVTMADWGPPTGRALPLHYWTTGDPSAGRRAASAAFGLDAPFERAPGTDTRLAR